MTHLLVFGGTGFLGGRLIEAARRRHHIVAATHHVRPIEDDSDPLVEWYGCDIVDRDAVERITAAVQPSAVVNAAYAQSGPESEAVCADGAGNIAAAAAEVGAELIHLSTDLVFDGTRGRYHEHDDPAPLLPYGLAKLRGEHLVAGAHPGAVIVRTSLIYGRPEAPQEQLTARAIDDEAIRFFTDEWRSPVHVDDLAEAVLDLVGSGHAGLLHLAGAERLSRLEFARALASASGLDESVLRGASSDASEQVRPKDTSLDSSAGFRLLGRRLPGVRERLGQSDSS